MQEASGSWILADKLPCRCWITFFTHRDARQLLHRGGDALHGAGAVVLQVESHILCRQVQLHLQLTKVPAQQQGKRYASVRVPSLGTPTGAMGVWGGRCGATSGWWIPQPRSHPQPPIGRLACPEAPRPPCVRPR